MKNFVLLFFVVLTISATAQKNELVFSYTALEKENYDYGQAKALTYYRMISKHKAFGIRAHYSDRKDEYEQFRAGGIDLLNRWTAQKKRFRFTAEAGVSAIKTMQQSDLVYFCGVLSPGERAHLPSSQWNTFNYIGFTAGLGVDIQVIQCLKLGTNYQLYQLWNNSDPVYAWNYLSKSNLNVNLAFSF